MTSKALVVLSGGQDSTTCLFWALQQGYDEVHAITFDYGQRHSIEIESAAIIARRAGVKSHEIVKLGADILSSTSPLTDNTALLEQYEDGDLPGGLEKTFVPMRNQLFLTIAANRAYALGCRNLITGVCQEDSGGYPDCRRVFVDYLQEACNHGTFTGEPGTIAPLAIHTPLMHLDKPQSVEFALKLPGCYEALAWTHTAYDGQFPPNGADHATVLRAQGFERAGIPDPLILRAVFDFKAFKFPRTLNYVIPKRIYGTQRDPNFDSFDMFLERVMYEMSTIAEAQEGTNAAAR